MDLTKEIAAKFKIQEEAGSNGSGVKAEVQKKVISVAEVDLAMQGFDQMLHEAEEGALEAGYEQDSIIIIFERINQMISDRIKVLKGEPGQEPVKVTTAPIAALAPAASSNGSVKHESPAIEQKKETPAEKKNLLDYIYDFETFPPLTCMFLGAGPNVVAEGRPLRTWKVRDLDKTEWLIPQWAIFSEVQGSFLGFQAEQPEKYVYRLEYKGSQPLPQGGIKFLVQILKKFPG